jgi:hypothetical protein
MDHQVGRRQSPGVSLVCLLAVAAGCGGDGITRHQVSGKVTYRGQEVIDGALVFEPDASIGQIAPTSFARIANGTYQTDRAESPTTGKYKVRVMGIPVPSGRLDIEVPHSRPRAKGK